MKFTKISSVFCDRRGEVGTVAIIIGMVIIGLGILVGNQLQDPSKRINILPRAADLAAIPNCLNLTGPSTLTVGQAGTYSATATSAQGQLAAEIFVNNMSRIKYSGLAGTSGSITATWTPTAAGTYTIGCRAWNDSIAECRPPNLVDAVPRYPCTGPNYQMTVTVNAVPTATPKPPTSTPITLPTPTNFPSTTISCSVSGTNVTWTWGTVAGATDYFLDIKGSDGSSFSEGWIGANTRSKTIPGNPGITYTGKVMGTSVQRKNGTFASSACIVPYPTPTPFCTDSDGGLNYTTKGTVTGNGSGCGTVPATDLCANTSVINEMHCGSAKQCFTSAYTCPGGCKDGVCLPTPTLTRTPTSTCVPVPAPKNLQPQGNISPGAAVIKWDPASLGSRYYLRVNDISDPWKCPAIGKDVCTGEYNNANYVYTFIAGHVYDIWVHSTDCGYVSAATSTSVTVVAPTAIQTPTLVKTRTPTPTKTPTPTISVSLQSVTISGTNVTVTYAKNFSTCAHLLLQNNTLTHSNNFYCTSGSTVQIVQPLSAFTGIASAKQVKLCHGNNYNICSSLVTVIQTSTPTSVNTPPPPVYCYRLAQGDATCNDIIDDYDLDCWAYEYVFKKQLTEAFSNGQKCEKSADFNGQNGVGLLDFAIWRLNRVQKEVK